MDGSATPPPADFKMSSKPNVSSPAENQPADVIPWQQLQGDITHITASQINDGLQWRTEGKVLIPEKELIRLQHHLPPGIDAGLMHIIELFESYTAQDHSVYPAVRRIPFVVQLPKSVQINGKIIPFTLPIAAQIFDIIREQDDQWARMEIVNDIPMGMKNHVPTDGNPIVVSDGNIKRTDCEPYKAHGQLLENCFGSRGCRYGVEAFLAELLRYVATGDYTKLHERCVMFRERSPDGDIIFWRGLKDRITVGLEAIQFRGAGTAVAKLIKNRKR